MTEEEKIIELDESIQYIDNYIDTFIILGTLLTSYKMKQNASPYVNFRDALNHYIRIYESDVNDDKKIYGNCYALKEHLFRGLKDTIVHIAYVFIKRIKCHLEENKLLTDKNKNNIRNHIHSLKNLLLDIRTSVSTTTVEKIKDRISEFNAILKDIKNNNDELFKVLIKPSTIEKSKSVY